MSFRWRRTEGAVAINSKGDYVMFSVTRPCFRAADDVLFFRPVRHVSGVVRSIRRAILSYRNALDFYVCTREKKKA